MQDLKARLLEERDRLQGEIEGLEGDLNARGMGESDTQHYGNHPADFADETYQAEMNRALEANLREQLRETEEALQRFEEGTYGVCTNCGREIPLERLEAMPQASRCLDCQKKASTLG